MNPKPTLAGATDAEGIAYVKNAILEAGADVRRRYPVLRHQDTIGAAIMASASPACWALRGYTRPD